MVPLPADLVTAYLARLGVPPGPPTAQLLRAVHTAQVERIAYEYLDTYAGRPPGIDPVQAARRFVTGGGGYCYHHNGALAALLAALGFDVRRHRGGVRGTPEQDVEAALGNHLVLTVSLAGLTWQADCGLGDLLHAPVPLRPGRFGQGPFTYELIDLGGGRWRLVHDPAQRSFCDMTFELTPASMSAFVPRHVELSTSPTSGFTRTLHVMRREADRVEGLLGRVRYTVDSAGRHERSVASPSEWFAILADEFGLTTESWTVAERSRIWDRVGAPREARNGTSSGPSGVQVPE